MVVEHATTADAFIEAANSWFCDDYSVDVRYFAQQRDDRWAIWAAQVGFSPLRSTFDYELRVAPGSFVLGQHQAVMKKRGALHLLQEGISGKLRVHGLKMVLPSSMDLSYQSEMQQKDRWYCDLHLEVRGTQRPSPTPLEASRLDNFLRANEVPFDGIQDALSWLGLAIPGSTLQVPSITMRVGPPVDLIFESCSLRENHLSLTLKAHRKFDVDRVGLAVRSVPGNGLLTRRQIASELKWRVESGLQVGEAVLPVDRADNVLAILMIGDTVVRRQWFIDPTRARNNRYFAMHHFDDGLKMVRRTVFEGEGRDFEHGVAALLFMYGFAPCAVRESDAPDLIVTTPNGRLVLVECTTKLSDVMAKVGQLVQRRGSLSAALVAAGHVGEVTAVLVCRAPRNEIAVRAAEIQSAKVLLLTGDALANAFDLIRIPRDPDTVLDDALKVFANPVKDS